MKRDIILDNMTEPPVTPTRWTLRERFDMFVVLPLGILGVIACGYFYYTLQMEYRAKVTAYCQPRGYVGGQAGKYAAYCITADGHYVQIPNMELR